MPDDHANGSRRRSTVLFVWDCPHQPCWHTGWKHFGARAVGDAGSSKTSSSTAVGTRHSSADSCGSSAKRASCARDSGHPPSRKSICRTGRLLVWRRRGRRSHGQHGHSSPSERRKDAQRRSELIEMGRLVYEHTYADVFETPQKVVRDLRRRLTSRLCPTS